MLVLVLIASLSACNLHPISRSLTRYGYMDTAGRVVIQMQFKDARSFSEGLAAVEVDGKWGYIDKSGKVAISRTLKAGWPFSEGLALIGNGGLI